MNQRIFFFRTLFFLLFQLVWSQSNYRNPLGRKALEADLNTLKFQLESVHAGLYEYSTKNKIDSAFVAIRQTLKDSMNDLDFYRALAPLQKVIKNGHTMVIPSEKWSKYKVDNVPLFPFEVYWDKDCLYILKNLSNDGSIIDGAQILSINGVTAEKVVENLLSGITRDGYNTTYPLHLMALGFEHWYADIIGTPKDFILELKSPVNQKIISKKVDALKEDKINSNHAKNYTKERVAWFLRSNDDFIRFKMNGNVATLVVPSFDSDTKGETGEKYSRFYKKVFAEMKTATIKHLILDLRNNGGGDPKPQLSLLSYLLYKPVKLYRQSFTIMEKVPNPEYYPNDKVKRLNRLAKLILDKKDSIYEVGNNIFTRMEGGPPKNPVEPEDDRFEGKLYILINGGSFSATGETAGILKDRSRGIFIGEEAGGSNYQNTSGRMPILYLPNSGVRIRMPLIAYKLNVEGTNDGHGVIPDFEVRNTVQQELNGEDAVMQFTLNYISKGLM
ncbi:MAG: S41 family peptidase [Croceivirga sp.]